MAEADKMLIAVEFDASGAIKDATVLDTKFDKLGNTLRKGEKRTEGLADAQKKLDKSIQGTTKSTTDNNVATIAKLQVMEAATSGLNQLISAQYKRIDADLAAGKITAEEAEELRKKVKQHEKLTGILETGIAMARLYTVAQVIGTAVMHKSTAATELNTAAVARNNAALAMNPYVRFAMIALTVISVLALMELSFDGVSRSIKRIREEVDKLLKSFSDLSNWNPSRIMGEKWDSLKNLTKGKMFGGGRLA